MEERDVVIIGAGPAGLSASIFTQLDGWITLVLDGGWVGGQGAKGLLNGPCGGASNGKCEADPERDCAWELIYHRLKKLGELDKWRKAGPVIKDYSKMARPRRMEVAPL